MCDNIADIGLLAKLDERIAYWNRKSEDPLQQIRADAFIEAFDLVKEWLEPLLIDGSS